MNCPLVTSTNVVVAKTSHTDSNIHPAVRPSASASQSNGAVTRLAAASPAESQTPEITGSSHTPIAAPPFGPGVQTDWPTFQKKLTSATDAPVTMAEPSATRTPNFPRPATWGLDALAP